jgi:transposase
LEKFRKQALKGFLTDHHRFLLRAVRISIQGKESLIALLEKEIDQHLERNKLKISVDLLQSIPGVGKDGATEIIAEIGNNMGQFPTEQHLASWAGMCPGNNESAGKKKSGRITHGNNYLKVVLVQCGWAATRTKGTYLRSKYDSLVGRRGKKRALIAVGHKILIATYFILKNQIPYKELGNEFLENKKKDKQILHHLKRLKELGIEVGAVA